ncbi:MAG TPA: alanyl-tRNA editing protein [Spirochaetia bacterium]|nr:alanyl-tRNA editing protein [Spirochaetia bacterium]
MHYCVTEKLYYDDPAVLEFDARALEIETRDGRSEVILDRTCFYPGGGGQPCDLGMLAGARVLAVEYRGEVIVHRVEHALGPEVLHSSVHGSVDGRRRREFMEQHTGQHIFSQALLRAGKLETVSVHFGDDDTTIELKADAIEESTLREAEDLANVVIKENRRVLLHEIDPSEVSKFPLRRTPPDAGRLRILEIENWDFAACGGVHLSSTGGVFLIKAVMQEKIRGRVRVHAMIGTRAMEDYGRKVSLLQSLGRTLTCGEKDIADRVAELLNREKESTREVRRLHAAQAAADADASVPGAPSIGKSSIIKRVFDAMGEDYLKAFAERVISVPGRICIAVDLRTDGFQWIAAHSLGDSLDLAKIVPGFFGMAGAKGGGRGARLQGVGTRREAAAGFADAIQAEAARRLGAAGGV